MLLHNEVHIHLVSYINGSSGNEEHDGNVMASALPNELNPSPQSTAPHLPAISPGKYGFGRKRHK